jgi:hypothetical protein
MKNRRAFLEQIAAERGLDPMDANTWSIITYKDVYTRQVSFFFCPPSFSFPLLQYFKGGSSLLYYYNGNFTKAVQDIFPS